jgi:hypothetical protein
LKCPSSNQTAAFGRIDACTHSCSKNEALAPEIGKWELGLIHKRHWPKVRWPYTFCLATNTESTTSSLMVPPACCLIILHILYVFFQDRQSLLVPILPSTIRLPKGPTSRGDIVRNHTAAIASRHYKRETLSIKVRVTLPVLAPVSRHWLPPSSRTFDGHWMHIASTANIGNQD